MRSLVVKRNIKKEMKAIALYRESNKNNTGLGPFKFRIGSIIPDAVFYLKKKKNR